jgi:cell filamentation protein
VSDPYSLPGGQCLRNKLGITDPERLQEAEARIVSVRDVEIARESLPGEYTLDHLQAFHRALFRDVYDWAGKTRTVDISKENARFCAWRFIDDQASAILGRLEGDSWLLGLKRERFLELLATYYGDLNVIHPFREGNGRTLRAFLRQLAAAAGWRLDWSALNPADNLEASRHNFQTADASRLMAVLDPVVVRI